MHASSTGTGIRVRQRHLATPSINTGILTAATRINFAGEQGLVFGVIAEGGWSTTDHLPAETSGRPLNTDAKYTDHGLREWMQKVMQVAGKRVVLEVDIGTNTSTIAGYLEWNGLNVGVYGTNVEQIADRLRLAAIAAGASATHVLLVSPWQSPGDQQRNNGFRSALQNVAQTRTWSYYDQEGELRDRSLSDGGLLGFAPQYRADLVHQNFDGMNVLGSVKWQTLNRSPCDSIDFNNDTLFPDDNDLIDFLSVLAGGTCSTGTCNDIDFNNDGLFPDDNDLVAFLRVLAGGNC